MSKSLITELSEEQKLSLPKYIEKWQALVKHTKPIDREKAKAAIENAYRISNYQKPEIIFTASPFGVIQKILVTENYQAYLEHDIQYKFLKRVYDHLFQLIKKYYTSNVN